MLPHPDAASHAIGDGISGQKFCGLDHLFLIEGDIGCLLLVDQLGPR